MGFMDKVKSFGEWLEFGKTVVEIMFAFGAGKLVKAVLLRFTEIPPIWVTPIWWLTTAVVMAALVFIGHRFWRRPSPQSTVQSAPNALMAPAPGNFDATTYFQQAYNSPLQPEVENNVRTAATQNQPNDREGFFVKLIGIGLIGYMYDIAWAYIFRSQILLMMELNRKILPIAEVKAFYDRAAAENPQPYSSYSFDSWMNFLKSHVLLIHYPTDMVAITERGRDFLKYLVHWGRYADDRKF